AAGSRLLGLAFGAYDFSRDTYTDLSGGFDTVQVPRSLIAMAARSRQLQPIDTVYAEIRDIDGLERDATFARRLGFSGKLCIHPVQVPVVNRVFTPSEASLIR